MEKMKDSVDVPNPYSNTPLIVRRYKRKIIRESNEYHEEWYDTYHTYYNELYTREYAELMLGLSVNAIKLYTVIKFKLLNKDGDRFRMTENLVGKYMKRTSYYAAKKELTIKLFIMKLVAEDDVFAINAKYVIKGKVLKHHVDSDNIEQYGKTTILQTMRIKSGGAKAIHNKHISDLDKHFNKHLD